MLNASIQAVVDELCLNNIQSKRGVVTILERHQVSKSNQTLILAFWNNSTLSYENKVNVNTH